MTVQDLIDALWKLPTDAPVTIWYEARCCESDDFSVFEDEGRVVIDADGWLHPLEEAKQ